VTELRNRVTSDLNGVTDLRVEVDGVPIRHLELFRFTSPVFSVTLPQNNVLQATGYTAAVPGAIFLAIAEGFYVMLKPLPVGEHTIAMRGRIPAIALTLDVTSNHCPLESTPCASTAKRRASPWCSTSPIISPWCPSGCRKVYDSIHLRDHLSS